MPPFWQWFFAIIGFAAFIMSFPHVLQLIFGQPKIALVFLHDDTGGEGRVMKVCLRNPPVDNRLLKALRVSRLAAQDVYLAVEVYNTSTRQLIDRFLPEIASSRSVKVDRISLPPSILLTNVALAKWQQSNNTAVLIGAKRLIPLQVGDYAFIIRVGLDGNFRTWKPAVLHIGKTEAEMVWDKSVADKILM